MTPFTTRRRIVGRGGHQFPSGSNLFYRIEASGRYEIRDWTGRIVRILHKRKFNRLRKPE